MTAALFNTHIRDNEEYLKAEIDSLRRLAGTSAIYAKAGGVIYHSITPVGNVGSGEDTLLSQAIAANVLATDGDSIAFRAWGTFAANGNAKRVRVKFGATTIFDQGAGFSPNDHKWVLTGSIYRTGAATQDAEALLVSGPGSGNVEVTGGAQPAETLSGAITFTITGEATSNDDIVARGWKLWWYPAGN